MHSTPIAPPQLGRTVAEIDEGYVRTWARFIFLRPARFYEEALNSTVVHAPPIKFGLTNFCLWAAGGTAVMAISVTQWTQQGHTGNITPNTFTPLFYALGAVVFIVDVPIFFLAALLAGERLSIDRLIDAKCYATALLPLFAAEALIFAGAVALVTADGNSEPAVIIVVVLGHMVASNILSLVWVLYNVGAVAAFNRISFARLLASYLAIIIPIGVVILAFVFLLI
jgi:hypothetical protein